ncbi:MAG: cytochrome b/b6 domain-containing protein [Gammaproteobacteria bacterium SHHR-1]|uniref:cytochrome b/b6 domain-containing protein n=1 Tax=Magnetovirga frankeli TaxID=947516 RepID=UPI00129315F4|nr:cytochrome b/b6 domain-containing protein [gamma proteobacterium SS-5]
MTPEPIQRLPIWDGWLRFSHALIGLACLALLVSGWLMRYAPSLTETAIDYHYLSAALLVFALCIRLALAISSDPVQGARALLPQRNEWPGMVAMLRFYLSLGRAPLPRWYAQNPLWRPIYLLIYLLLLVLALSGGLMGDRLVLLGIYLPSLHRELASVMFWLILLHLLAVILHDLRGKNSDISAMVHGQRCFSIDRPNVELPAQPVSISPQQIGGRGKDE